MLIFLWAILAVNTRQLFAEDDVNQQQLIDYIEEDFLTEREPRSVQLIRNDVKKLLFKDLRPSEENNLHIKTQITNKKKRQADANTTQKIDCLDCHGEIRNVEINDEFKENLKIAAQIEADLEKRIGKPLQLIQVQLDNITSSDDTETTEGTDIQLNSTTENSSLNFTDSGNDVLVLNDFIRFKREAVTERQNTVQSMEQQPSDDADGDNFGRTKREKEIGQSNEKISMQSNDNDYDNGREPRGAMREQWLKQPYPVQVLRESNYEDVSPLPSESIRAPKVHFVTHRVSEFEQSPPFYRSFEREGRSGDLKGDFIGDIPNDGVRDMNRDSSYRSGYRYDPHVYRQRYEPYYHHEEHRSRPYYPRYEQYNNRYTPGQDHYSYSSNRQQRRIIYYATLPEVAHGPSRAGLWGKFGYRDPYDDRYNGPTDSYRYRKSSYNPTKSRYDPEMEGSKTPLKVSTDLNVRETKKNPERRIYSETVRRYAHKTPSFRDEGYNGQQLN